MTSIGDLLGQLRGDDGRPDPRRLALALALGSAILGGVFMVCIGLPLTCQTERTMDHANDDTKLRVLVNEGLGDMVQADGTFGPPRCATPTPIAEVPGLGHLAGQGMHQTEWGEPYLFQGAGARFRVFSPRGGGKYRVVDSADGTLRTVDEDELTAPWP